MHMFSSLIPNLMQTTKGDDDLREDYSAHANKVSGVAFNWGRSSVTQTYHSY
jgi:hypothetical protein